MNTYELVVMYSPDIKEAGLKTQVADLTKKVEELGGKIKIAEDWGLKKLAYRIEKFEQAYYHIYALSIDSLKTNDVVAYLNHKEGVVRNLLSVLDKEQ